MTYSEFLPPLNSALIITTSVIIIVVKRRIGVKPFIDYCAYQLGKVRRFMARKDWYYPNISVEMAEMLDKIVEDAGRKYGIYNKGELVRMLLADFIDKYEDTKDMMAARKTVTLHDQYKDGKKPERSKHN